MLRRSTRHGRRDAVHRDVRRVAEIVARALSWRGRHVPGWALGGAVFGLSAQQNRNAAIAIEPATAKAGVANWRRVCECRRVARHLAVVIARVVETAGYGTLRIGVGGRCQQPVQRRSAYGEATNGHKD